MLSPTAVETTCSSSLDVMLMHNTLYGEALTSIPEDTIYWNIWQVLTLIFLIKVTNLPLLLALGRRLLI
jgi:hypothetical protein